MDSRIILTKADFSANNIGRYVELSDLTKKVLAKQTQYGFDSEEAIALDTFLGQLTMGGFIGGDNPLIKDMFIPALASGHDELLYNIAYLDGNGYPTNGMSQAEQEAEMKALKAVLSGDRVIGMQRTDVNEDVIITARIFDGLTGQHYPSHSYVLYGNMRYSGSFDIDILANRAQHYRIYLRNNATMLRYDNQPDNIVKSELTIPSDTYGFAGLSLIKETDTTYSWEGLINGGTVGTSTQEGDKWGQIVVQENSKSYAYSKYYSSDLRRYIGSFLAFADYINSTKMAELKGYVDTLMAALHVM